MKEINPDEVNVSFAGHTIEGYADGEFIQIVPNADLFNTHFGTDGKATRVRNLNRGALVTFRLAASSSSNDVLSTIANLDKVPGSSGAGVGVFNIEDLNGTLELTAAEAWIEREPDVTRGDEATMYEWVIACERIDGLIGGT